MQWKLGTWHELSYNVINTSNNKYAMDLEALDKETTGKLSSVQWSVYKNCFSFLFSTWTSTRTHMKTVVPPQRMPVSHTRFQEDGKKLGGYCWVLSFGWLVCFPPSCTLRSFIMLLGICFCTSLLPFVILPVLVPKYPFSIFYHVSSKSIN